MKRKRGAPIGGPKKGTWAYAVLHTKAPPVREKDFWCAAMDPKKERERKVRAMRGIASDDPARPWDASNPMIKSMRKGNRT
jgi:hypothetical protein